MFPEWWIPQLKKMVERNVTVPHRFVCLSNIDVPCERIELQDDLRGWWSKIELFRPGIFEGRVFYLDLDTLVLDNIDELLEQEDDFIGLKPFNPKRAAIPSYFASGLMGWIADGSFDFLYEKFTKEQMPRIKWDQEYLSGMLKSHHKSVSYWQELVDGIYSYKRDIRYGKVTTTPRVVCFHGNPRPWKVMVYNNVTRA